MRRIFEDIVRLGSGSSVMCEKEGYGGVAILGEVVRIALILGVSGSYISRERFMILDFTSPPPNQLPISIPFPIPK